MNNYKIKLNNEAESKEAQDLFEQLGFTWAGDYPENGDWYSHLYAEKSTCCHLPIYVWNGLGDKFQELTLPQLRDLVVLHRNDVKDATHSCDDLNGAAIKLSGTWYGYNYFKNEWQPWDEIEDDEYKISDLKPIQKSPEHGLISGADALRDFSNSQVSEDGSENWVDLSCCKYSIKQILDEKDKYTSGYYKLLFRIKPCTITLCLEIPAPFEPKEGEAAWCLDGNTLNGYKKVICDDFIDSGIGFWRTEEEIKQIVAALRGGIKG